MSASATSTRRPFKIVLIVLASLLAFVLLILLGACAYFRLSVAEYYSNSERTFKIPGVHDGMVLQGLAYDSSTEEFYVTGYRTDGAASQVGIVKDNAQVKIISLSDENGVPFTGHVGGITLTQDYVYIADGNGLIVYSHADFTAAQDGASVRALGVFSTASDDDSLSVAFTHVEGDTLYVGEFYREGNYATPDSHKYTTATGDSNTALILAYKLNADEQFGISPTIEAVYSVTGLVQGMCFDEEGRFLLSTSYGPAFSHIYIYDEPKEEGEFTVLDQTAPLYVLDSSNLVLDMKIAPMSEEIVVVDNKLYVMCESASNKYIFGKFTSAQYCYATDLSAYFK